MGTTIERLQDHLADLLMSDDWPKAQIQIAGEQMQSFVSVSVTLRIPGGTNPMLVVVAKNLRDEETTWEARVRSTQLLADPNTKDAWIRFVEDSQPVLGVLFRSNPLSTPR